jgi:hypothetical protein
MTTRQQASPGAISCGTLGLIGLIVGSVGPWATSVFGDVAGTRGDGAITLVLGIAAALALAAGQLRKWSLVGAAVALVAALGVAGYDAIHIEQGLHHATLFGHQVAAAGWGVYVAVAGAAIALAALAAVAIPVSAARYVAMALPILAGVGIFAAGAAIESHRTSTPESVNGTSLSSGSCSVGGIPHVVSSISFTNGTCSAAQSAVRKVESGNETWTFVGRPYGAQSNGAATVNATSAKGAQCAINSTPGENHWSCSGKAAPSRGRTTALRSVRS